MWTRQRPEHQDDNKELQERDRLLSALSGKDLTREPEPAYWTELIARTNRRLDDVSSAKALSISWVARVAIPGAVSILFFFIGLHYYVPERQPDQVTVSEVVLALPRSSQDSLATYILDRMSFSDSGGVSYADVFELTEEELEQYLVHDGASAVVVGSLTDEQVRELLHLLQKADRKSLPREIL
jgi:hypothetical protein